MTELTEKDAMLPCPFCGGDYQTISHIRDGMSLGCSKCGARFTKYYGRDDILARLVGFWNTRAAMPAPKIKKLVWESHPLGILARTGFYGATYLIAGLDTSYPYFMNWPAKGSWPKITHADEGKALAQADYEARWLAALDTPAAITPDKEASDVS